MPSRRFRSRLTVPAIAFDAVAGAGLVLVVLAGFFRGNALGLIVPGLALGFAVLPGAALSTMALLQESAARGVARRVSGTVAAVLCVCALAIGPAGLALGWALTPNTAADQAAPVVRDLRSAGAVPLCEGGDAGRGPDNFVAWQTGYYRVPADEATPSRLQQLARSHGHTLARRSAEGTDDPEGIDLATAGNDSDERSLSMEISRGPVVLQCTVDGVYGHSYTPPEGQRLVVVSSSAPAWLS